MGRGGIFFYLIHSSSLFLVDVRLVKSMILTPYWN